jgi:ribosomal protein L13
MKTTCQIEPTRYKQFKHPYNEKWYWSSNKNSPNKEKNHSVMISKLNSTRLLKSNNADQSILKKQIEDMLPTHSMMPVLHWY